MAQHDKQLHADLAEIAIIESAFFYPEELQQIEQDARAGRAVTRYLLASNAIVICCLVWWLF